MFFSRQFDRHVGGVWSIFEWTYTIVYVEYINMYLRRLFLVFWIVFNIFFFFFFNSSERTSMYIIYARYSRIWYCNNCNNRIYMYNYVHSVIKNWDFEKKKRWILHRSILRWISTAIYNVRNLMKNSPLKIRKKNWRLLQYIFFHFKTEMLNSLIALCT